MDKIQKQSAKRQASCEAYFAAGNTHFPPGVSIRGRGITSLTLKMVAMMIAKHANGKLDGCYPSYNTIARESGITRAVAIDAVRWLAGIRLFAKKPGTRRGSNTYVWRKCVKHPKIGWVFQGWEENAPDSPQPLDGMTTIPDGMTTIPPQYGTHTTPVCWSYPNESLMAKLNDEENEGRTESLDGDGTDWESPSSSPPQSQSLTGIPGDGSKAYAKIMGELTGEEVKHPVRPKPEPPVQPVSVQPETPVPQAPPVPPNPPKLWETWDKPIDGITAQDIKRALEFWGKDSKDPYYRENEKLTDAYVSNPKNARRLVDTTPPEYQPKKPASVPATNCPDCHGRGQLTVKAGGDIYCPPCWCLKAADGPHMLPAKPDCPLCDRKTGEVSRKEVKLMNGDIRTDITWCGCLRPQGAAK